MTGAAESEKSRPSNTKIALAVVLGLVFVIVVAVRVVEFMGGDESSLADQSTRSASRPTVRSPRTEVAPPSKSRTETRRTPRNTSRADGGKTRSGSPVRNNSFTGNAATGTPSGEGDVVAGHAVDVSRLVEFNPFHPAADPTASEDSFRRPLAIAERPAEERPVGDRSDPAPGLFGRAIRWFEQRVTTLTAADLGETLERVGALVFTDSPEPPDVEVAGIMTGGNRPAALIGDQLYFENDQLDERWRVVKIAVDGVIVELATAP